MLRIMIQPFRIVMLLSFSSMIILSQASPALAISNPDSPPIISNVKINKSLIETGDMVIYGDYDIPYASIPSVDASDTFIFRLIDTDNTTELGAIVPYVMIDYGYNKGVFGFYFSAADAPTWGQSYIIRISQNPTYFPSPISTDYVMATTAYTTKTSQEDNQTEMAINIINAAQRMQSNYPTYTFLEDSAGGTVLSSPTGETYFRGTIYGIQAMAPSLFLVQVLSQSTEDRAWTTNQSDTYEERFDSTWVGTSVNATANQFGITPQMAMGMGFILPLCLGAIVVSSMRFRRTEPGFMASFLFMFMGELMGWFPTAIFGVVLQAMSIYIAYLWFFARG